MHFITAPLRSRLLGAVLLAALAPCSALGQAWSVSTIDVVDSGQPHALVYGNGRFVMVMRTGSVPLLWSTEGTNWQPVLSPPPLSDVEFIGGAFYGIGRGSVWRSVDGNVWTSVRQGLANSEISATDGRGMMIAGPTPTRTLTYSPDMEVWRATAPLPFTRGVVGEDVFITHFGFGAGRYFVSYLITGNTATGVANGYAVSTVDGTEWTTLSNSAVFAGNNQRAVLYSGTLLGVSTDGTNFAFSPRPAELRDLSTKLLAAGDRFFSTHFLTSSQDGIAWAPLANLSIPTTATFTCIAYGNGRYVAGGWDLPFGAPRSNNVLAVLPAAGAPVLTRQPAAQTTIEGRPTTLTVALENPDANTSFQWRRNGINLPGATLASLTIAATPLASAGDYTVLVRNGHGSMLSAPAPVAVVPVAQAGRLVNLSVLGALDRPDDSLTVGFVVSATGTRVKPLLVRAGGPSLSGFGVSAPNADPKLELFAQGNRIAQNDDWGGGATLAAAGTQVGAFPYASPTSKDAALFSDTIPAGPCTFVITANGGAAGVVLGEVYDATPEATIGVNTPRLVNVSVAKRLAASATLSAGFVIAGTTPVTVLLRAVGPGLSPHGVTDAVADPVLTVYRSGTPAAIATNDNWGGGAELRDVFTAVGAFPITANDAAVRLVLPPGNYSAQTAAGAVAGTVLVEIYEVQ